MHQDLLTLRRKLCALRRNVFPAQVDVAVHKVGDDLDGPLNVELFYRALLQIF